MVCGCSVSVWAGVVQTAGLSSCESSHWQSDPPQRRLRSHLPLWSQVSANYYNSNSQFVLRASSPILMFWDCNPDSEAPKPVISFLLGWGHTLRFTITSGPWSVMRLNSFGRRRKLYVCFLFMYSCTMKICKAVFTLIRADMHIYWLICVSETSSC